MERVDSKSKAQVVEQECGVAAAPGIYVVGSFSRGVSFLTQQLRSLNLVWALFELGKLSGKSTLAVIGGGLAGLSAAAAAKSKGCNVILYESSDVLMRLQANSKLRYVHPQIHRWPDVAAFKNETELPVLNWRADNAHNVRLRILRQWNRSSKGIDVRTDHEVSTISVERSQPVVTYAKPRFGRDTVDCAVVTVGFGTERPWQSRPYWEPDGLDYRLTTSEPRIWVISGCGDGGLIDVLRLRFADFDYAEILSTLLDGPDSKFVATRVSQIEADSKHYGAPDDRGGFLFNEYRKLIDTLPAEVSAKLRARLRPDTRVHLISPHPTPFSTSSMPVNRTLLSLLLSKDTSDGLQYHQGQCTDDGISQRVGLQSVQLSNTPARVDPILCHQVLFRHGPEPTVDRILYRNVCDELRKKHVNTSGPTAMATDNLWPPDFYPVVPDVEPEPLTLPVGKLATAGGPFGSDAGPLYCGDEIEGVGGGHGTLGCFVRLPDRRVAILSTSHVLASGGQASLGGEVVTTRGNHRSPIGHLHSFVELRRFERSADRQAENAVDAAIAVLSEGITYEPRFSPRYNLPSLRSTRSPRIGERVFKVGASTGLTFGTVDMISLDILVDSGKNKLLFVDSFGIAGGGTLPGKSFADVGDSGALIVGEDGAPLAILFAVSNSFAVACSLVAICETLSCSVMTERAE